MLPEIDVIVPTHGRLDLTISCFARLYEHTQAPFQLIVVDDSDDETPAYMEEFKKTHDNVTFIHHDEPYLCGNQFVNESMKYCKNQYAATVMNSVWVTPDWEIAALRLMQDDSKIGIIGFKSLMLNGRIESAGISRYKYICYDRGRGEPAHHYSDVDEPYSLQWAHALLRKEAVVGNLAEDIYHGFAGFDDVDNTLVLKELGWKAVYCGMGVSYHQTHATRGSDEAEKARQNQENALAFYKRWGLMDMYLADNPIEVMKLEFAGVKNSLNEALARIGK